MFSDILFDGETTIFHDCFSGGVSSYWEFGCGSSTLWVLANTAAEVRSVDTSPVWADRVRAAAAALPSGAGSRLTLGVVDVGELGDWGTPLSYRFADRFPDYTESVFAGGASHEVILVDGRFRVACTLTSLLHSRPGTRIVVDDYYRERYHIIEDVVAFTLRDDRQALFVVPESFDREHAEFLRERFLWVFD